MHIPRYWAEREIEFSQHNKLKYIRRFGWSDTSPFDAEQHALQRCEEAKQHLLFDKKGVRCWEGNHNYLNIPIREQIVQHYPELNAITTINSYGATCLNVENVMILDIDDDDLIKDIIKDVQHAVPPYKELSGRLFLFICGLMSLFLLICSSLFFNTSEFFSLLKFAIPCVIIAIVLTFFIFLFITDRRSQHWHKMYNTALNTAMEQRGGIHQILDDCLNPFLSKFPELAFNVYRTPKGFRLIALNQQYLPDDAITQQCFEQLPIDKTFVKLCHQQQCFRARVTAKPWRIQQENELYPAGRIPSTRFWLEDDHAMRQQWLEEYQQLASHYAACHFIKRVGNANIIVHEQVLALIQLHDDLSQSHRDLPLA